MRSTDVYREWRRDNGVWCKGELEHILTEYPWSKETADFYGMVCAKLYHIYSPRAMIRLHEWMALHQAMRNQPYMVDEGLMRFKVQKDILAKWVKKRRQWATVADIGGQQGEMGINWIGLPGVKRCVVVELAMTNCKMGNLFYNDPRLHFVQAMGERCPLQDNSVDVAILSGVLEHVLAPDQWVAEAERITRPKGLIMIQVPYGGAEGAPNPEADKLSFRSHVQSINPFKYIEDHRVVAQNYLRYTGIVHFPHAMIGEAGEFTVAYER